MSGPEVPEEILALAERRAAARLARDYALADRLRADLAARGWEILDGAQGWRLLPAAEQPATDPLALPPDRDVSVHWVLEGWPDDVRRGLAAFRAHAGARRIHYVVADVTGAASFDEEVEIVSLPPGTGWAEARNAGLRRTRGRIAVVVDGSIEPRGDVLGPLEAALADPSVGVCGPLGIVTRDLRTFERGPEAGDCDAIEGYLMACRREVLLAAGLFDEGFRWYRSADIEWSFRIKEQGLRVVATPAPIAVHEHRMWESIPPDERARRSKKNFYRFLDRYRDRWDLVVAGAPPATER